MDLPTHTRGLALVALLSLGVTSACATAAGDGPSPFDESRDGAVVLRVENGSFQDTRIYLVWNGTMTVPLGHVEAMDSRTWRIPPARIAKGSAVRSGSFRLEARFHPSRDRCASAERLLADGSRWIWQLHNDMAFATLVVR